MTPDYRIVLSPTKINFSALGIGESGLDIESYPAPGQSRFDWMRSVILGLLTQQASFDAPTQKLPGTLWFDLNNNTLKIYTGGAWCLLSDVITVYEGSTSDDVITLASWYATVSSALSVFSPDVTFSGECTQDGITQITVPTSLRTGLGTYSRCFMFINGLAIDPRNCALQGGTPPTTIRLTNVTLDDGDTFTVIFRSIQSEYFHQSTVSVP